MQPVVMRPLDKGENDFIRRAQPRSAANYHLSAADAAFSLLITSHSIEQEPDEEITRLKTNSDVNSYRESAAGSTGREAAKPEELRLLRHYH